MARHNEHSIKILQLTDLLHVLQVTLTDIRRDKSIKKLRNVMTKVVEYLLPLNPLITDAINFMIRETVRISKYLKLNSFI